MHRFVYKTGLFHPCGDLSFGDLQSVWSFVNYLDVNKKLVGLVCSDENGNYLDESIADDDQLIPGIIEEMIAPHFPFRRWVLFYTYPPVDELAGNIINGLDNVFGNRNLYGAEEIASVIAGHKFKGNIEELATSIGKLIGHEDDGFVAFVVSRFTKISEKYRV